MKLTPFHLAIQVRDIDEAREFYGRKMGFPEGRSADRWIDFNMFGHQLVTHLNPQIGEKGRIASISNEVDGHGVPIPHFGVVLNFDDPATRELANQCKAQVWGFSRLGPVENGVCLDAGAALIRAGGQVQRISLGGLQLTGVHNLENVLAALAVVTSLGVDPTRAIRALPDFSGLPHRCEWVASVAGVKFINDSKATNPGAAARSLEGMGTPLVWIAGGRDKGLDFAALADVAAATVEAALFYGEAAGPLMDALAGRIDARRVENLSQAVVLAAARAKSGDTVLLAPACASFDQFKNFEERGEHFCRAVRDFAQETKS
jgi:UDP-N-acetylmuramoylalanine--D-glutamate ligase